MWAIFKQTKPAEQGQAIVMLALAIVGMLGFAAIALDGGNIYTEQRRAQTAADNAAIAAAYVQMFDSTKRYNNTALGEAAAANALLNGYVDGSGPTQLTFHRPPIDGPYKNNDRYVEVIITQTVQTALAHLVYSGGAVKLTVRAVAHGDPIAPVLDGFAVAAMHTSCDQNDFTARGGTVSVVRDAGVFVNGYCGSGQGDTLNMNGAGAGIVTTNSISCPDMTNTTTCLITGEYPIQITSAQQSGTTCTNTPPFALKDMSSCNFYPAPDLNNAAEETDPIDDYVDVDALDTYCTKTATLMTVTTSATNQPGLYTTLSAHGDVTLASGIYCISGDDDIMKNVASLTGDGVMLYMMNAASSFKYAGGTHDTLTLSAMDSTDCAASGYGDACDFQGIVIYKPKGMDNCSSSSAQEFEFKGQSSMNIEGLIYAPKSYASFGGQGTLTMTGQAIVGCVRYAGTGTIDVVYEPDKTYRPPASISLDQ